MIRVADTGAATTPATDVGFVTNATPLTTIHTAAGKKLGMANVDVSANGQSMLVSTLQGYVLLPMGTVQIHAA